MQHRPTGCLFDETAGAEEFRMSLVGAHLCTACEGKLSEMMLPDEALEAVNQILGYVRSATIRKVRPPATSVFVGHGRADDWKPLAAFLQDELKSKVIEFNSDPTAGIFTGERILDMLDRSRFAFLVMTAEDEQTDGTFQARQNVIHEIGLCQGRLGFRRAVMVKEDCASEFSNVKGLTYIGFQRGVIADSFPEVARTLVREGLVDIVVAEQVLRKLKPKQGAS
jgi:predicted nucleotide-binding protein